MNPCLRYGKLETHGPLFNRMIKSQAAALEGLIIQDQELPIGVAQLPPGETQKDRLIPAVDLIPYQRETEGAEGRPDLMGLARMKATPQ